jgi:hypothetical protein
MRASITASAPRTFALDVDPRRDLAQLKPVGGQSEHAALGDVQHLLRARGGVGAAEGHVLDLPDEFSRRALVEDNELVVFDRHAQPAGVEGADEYHLLGVLADVDEAAGASELGSELADV